MTGTYEDKLEEFMHEWREARERLRHARARWREAEDSKKRVVALAMANAEAKGRTSLGAREQDAYSSALYKEWIGERVEASLDLDQAQDAVDELEKRWEAWRERAWNRRAEMKLTR